jgi:hypothetical protein
MCYNCYHKSGREKKAWNCKHTNKPNYALGKCHNCYQWTNNTKKNDKNNLNEVNNDPYSSNFNVNRQGSDEISKNSALSQEDDYRFINFNE